MNKRENLLSLLHRNGYEQVPVHFDLCPELAEKMEGMFDPDGIGIPWKNICDSRLVPAAREEYERYYRNLQPGAEIDAWGVAHEKGSAAAKHMTYMRHPLDGLDSLEAVKEYPFPALKLEEEAQKRDVEACIAAGLAPVGNMQMTIWEQSWYLRGMENLMVDMICNEPVAEYIFDAVTEINTRRAEAFRARGGGYPLSWRRHRHAAADYDEPRAVPYVAVAAPEGADRRCEGCEARFARLLPHLWLCGAADWRFD